MDKLLPLLETLAHTRPDNDGAPLAALMAALRPDARKIKRAEVQTHFKTLLAILEGRPDLAKALGDYLSTLLAARRHRFSYAEGGVLENTGFFAEFWRRLGQKGLPPALDARFLRDLLDEAFDRGADIRWLIAVPQESWLTVFKQLGFIDGTSPGLQHAQEEMAGALRILAHRLAAIGLEPELVRYYAPLVQYESPFLALQRETDIVVERVLHHLAEGATGMSPDSAHAEVLIEQCEEALERIRKQAHEDGVTIRLTWHLTRARQMLTRMRELLALLEPSPANADPEDKARMALAFMLELLRATHKHNSVRGLFAQATDLLARQITEQASKTGEHYVTANRREFFAMFRAAAGAGFVVALMAALKLQLLKWELAPLWEAVVQSLFYGCGFVLIHLLGFTLATKQPAMTAATLAAALDPKRGSRGPLDEMTELIVQVSRSQWIAIIGNVLLGFSTALVLALAWQAGFGHLFIDAATGAANLHGLHPLASPALLYAAIAGVCLFLSGLVSGYYDNKALYHSIPERIKRVGALQWLGVPRLARLADYLEHNLGALAGNFAFGCMLGAITPLGTIIGVPLGIQHVTFASANLAYGLDAVKFSGVWHEILACSAGVFLIGMVNLGVSFSLAMRVALKSRGVRVSNQRELVRALWRRFVTMPRDFFWPPKESNGASPSNGHGNGNNNGSGGPPDERGDS